MGLEMGLGECLAGGVEGSNMAGGDRAPVLGGSVGRVEEPF